MNLSMHRTFALTLNRPSDALGLPTSMSRRFARTGIHPAVWVMLLVAVSLFSIGFYVFQVSTSAQKTFTMRNLEKQSDRLEEVVAQLDQQVIREQAMNQLQTRVKEMGYIPVDKYEFIKVGGLAAR